MFGGQSSNSQKAQPSTIKLWIGQRTSSVQVSIRRRGISFLRPDYRRSPGLHISEIRNRICVAAGYYPESEPNWLDNPNTQTRIELGQALESALVSAYQRDEPGRYTLMGELFNSRDFIYYTSDLYDRSILGPHEIKLTWMSSKNQIGSKKLWGYLAQLKTYCFNLQATKSALDVCYVNGDYSLFKGKDKREAEKLSQDILRRVSADILGHDSYPVVEDLGAGGNPDYVTYDLEFEWSDLSETWDSMVEHAISTQMYEEHYGGCSLTRMRERWGSLANYRESLGEGSE